MRAVRQGELDALCGLYAIVNALEVVGVRGRRSSLHSSLFRRLVASVGEDHLRDAIWHGISTDDLIAAAQKAFRWLHRRYRVKLMAKRAFARKPPTSSDAFFNWLDAAMAEPRQGVIINFVMPWTDHWAVAVRRQGFMLVLRDSSGRQTLDLRRFRLRGGAYRIRAASTLLVTRVGGPDEGVSTALQPISSPG